ncbi:MAG: hypothetical protein J6J42_08130 [Lachnospiraceae bacterium]|nr:hypothetical protein [Lachnospiraceae bacterium]MBP3610287.1 hypothetical protein [Lachnospiraceae bacterium]
MDWTDKLEQNRKNKKNLRKMAGRMLWADVRDVICSWKCLLLVFLYLGFLLLPYLKKVDTVNIGAYYYMTMWLLMLVEARVEKQFHFLPLSTKDIVYYLVYRTNLLTAWIMVISLATGLLLQAFGVEIFLERGIIMTTFLLVTLEGMFLATLCGYCKPEKVSLMESGLPRARKIRFAIYGVYCVVLLLVGIVVAMFMDYNENVGTKMMVVLGAYAVMFIFRADVMRWVKIEEYTKVHRRSIYGNLDQRTTLFTPEE